MQISLQSTPHVRFEEGVFCEFSFVLWFAVFAHFVFILMSKRVKNLFITWQAVPSLKELCKLKELFWLRLMINDDSGIMFENINTFWNGKFMEKKSSVNEILLQIIQIICLRIRQSSYSGIFGSILNPSIFHDNFVTFNLWFNLTCDCSRITQCQAISTLIEYVSETT